MAQTQSQSQTRVSAPQHSSPTDSPAMPAARARKQQTFLDRFLRHRSAMIGAVILAVVVVVALLVQTGLLINHDPTLAMPQSRFARPMAAASPPVEGTYILGTDNLGRDVYSRVIKG